MKITELLKIADEKWVRKAKGYRVRFQKREGDNWVVDYMPDLVDPPLLSDVVAWRSAWKLLKSSRPDDSEFVNLTAVDDRAEPVRYYANGQFEVFNPREGITTAPVKGPSPALTPDEGGTFTKKQIDTDARGSESQPSSEESDK
jgi:hypothetical protein